MSEGKFKPSDQVRLIGGKRRLTVEGYDQDGLTICAWQARGETKRAKFKEDALEIWAPRNAEPWQQGCR